MARKSIKGYAEKNYYDNTKFSGGIVATNDSLNEGYFKHLVNFDISDTGQSLIPRKGFITTMFKNEEDYWAPSNNSIYFYDEALGKYIFYVYGTDPYLVDFALGNKYLNDIKIISNVDATDLRGLYGYNLKYMNPIGTNKAIRVKDEYNITCYIIKMSVTLNSGEHDNLYLKLYYNKQDDTLVVSYLDTQQIVNYVDTNYRNLASSKSVIPDPMQEIYPNDNIPIGHYDQFPMIYVKNDEGKYLINEIKDVTSFKVIPNFYLAEDEREDYTWGYTYEIFSTNKDLQYTEDTLVYKSPIYYFDGTRLTESTLYDSAYAYFLKAWTDLVQNSSNQGVNVADIYNKRISPHEYKTNYLNNISTYTESILFPDYILYFVPASTPSKEVTIDFNNDNLSGPYGLASYFSNYNLRIVYPNSANQGALEDLDDDTYPVDNEKPTHNDIINNRDSLLSSTNTIRNTDVYTLRSHTDFSTLLEYARDNNWAVYVKPLNLQGPTLYSSTPGGFQDCVESILNSFIYAWETAPLSISEFMNTKEYQEILNKASKVACKVLPYKTQIKCKLGTKYIQDKYPLIFSRLFTNMPESIDVYKEYTLTYNVREFVGSNGEYIDSTYALLYDTPDTVTTNAQIYNNTELGAYKGFSKFPDHPFNSMFIWDDSTCYPILCPDWKTLFYVTINTYPNVFQMDEGVLKGVFNKDSFLHNKLTNLKFYDTGVLINFYIVKVPTQNNIQILKTRTRDYILALSAKLMQARQLNKVTYEPTTYIEYLTEEPELIKNAEGMIKYDSMLGSHLVLYTGNKLFISKEGMQYYFFNYNTFDFPEEIVKVIQYKEILLVFTTQDLYAVYLEEVTTEVLNGYNEDGIPKYVQQKSYEFRSQVVLYNLMVDKRYIDAIQVYNQMVLFYSSDGQMFLIKPTAAITSDTRFSIQYFNKSANDILLNYKDYMQRRLQEYGIDGTIEDVDIKVSATLNYIKIFYSAPELITYILVYDVINNRYYVYDTISFTSIKYLHYTPIGELYITEHKGKFYFTLPYTNMYDMDNNVDVNCYDYFNPYPINAEIDTGTINLNNHLKKRFKDLHVIYKNLNANSVEFAVETFVDDIPIVTYVSNSFEVRDINGAKTLTIVESNRVKELIDHASLLSFIDYTSNKIITHRTNIISRGKTIRVKMNFKSKGKYKIQGFGLIYKEHTV